MTFPLIMIWLSVNVLFLTATAAVFLMAGFDVADKTAGETKPRQQFLIERAALMLAVAVVAGGVKLVGFPWVV